MLFLCEKKQNGFPFIFQRASFIFHVASLIAAQKQLYLLILVKLGHFFLDKIFSVIFFPSDDERGLNLFLKNREPKL